MARKTTPPITTDDGTVWEVPGPGSWTSGADHVAHAVTASFIELYEPARNEGMRAMFRNYGIPAQGYDGAFVNGWMYDRLVPLVGAESSAAPPPAPILWVATRLHPEFRRRTKVMAATFGDPRGWRKEGDNWDAVEKHEWRDRNLAITDEDPATLDDAELIDHVRRVRDHYTAAVTRHFSLKGADSAPLGDLLALTDAHDIPSRDVVALLAGGSPTSAVPETLAAVAQHVRDAGAAIETLDDVRALGDAASAALADHLREHGCRVIGGYDIDAPTLAEMPGLVARSIAAAATAAPAPHAPPVPAASAQLHDRVPADVRAELDRRFAEAIRPYGIRDENGPLTFQWPVGLLRRAMLECGRRLQETGALHVHLDVLELRTDEVLALMGGRTGVTADEAARRAERRAEQTRLSPPPSLGPEDVPPPLDAMPAPLARGIRAVTSFIACMSGDRAGREPLRGVGIGQGTHAGRAIVVDSPEDAFLRMEPGDVLVTACTTPAYNSVLMIAGAVVTDDGGPLSHAAIMARELGIPAVVGALGATTSLRDGDTVEVDADTGEVRIGAPQSAPAGTR